MSWRFLVDEDTDERCVDHLAERGFDADSVASALGKAHWTRASLLERSWSSQVNRKTLSSRPQGYPLPS